MSSQLSAQAITAQTAMTRISIRRCSTLPWQRGSPTALRCRTRLSMDMILFSPGRGHVIIHQARASDKNFMRLPCRLRAAGCKIIRAEKVSGKSRAGRDELASIMEFIRVGDELVVVKLDRLGRSTRDVLNLVHELEVKGAALTVLEPVFSTKNATG